MSDDESGGIIIPIRPQLADSEIAKLLQERMKDSVDMMEYVCEDLKESIHAAEENPPHEYIFAYGQLVQYLKTLERSELEHLLAGALWKLV